MSPDPSASYRRFGPDGEAPHDATMAGVVVDREMLGAAIVPHRQGSRRPVDAAGEFGTNGAVGENNEGNNNQPMPRTIYIY